MDIPPSLISYDYPSQHVSFSISNDNSVYSFGYSEYYNHGHNTKDVFPPKQIDNLINIKMIDCGTLHTICLDYNGNLFSFGGNSNGQLGLDKNENELEKTHIPQKINIPPIRLISCGDEYTICLSEEDILYAFGKNEHGLGIGNTEDCLSPTQIPGIHNIEYIICGGCHSICKSFDNKFYSWGYNNHGELGNGTNESCNTPILCDNWPNNIVSIKCGGYFSLLLTSEGHIYSFGMNNFGQLGIGDNVQSINTPSLVQGIPEIQRIDCAYYSAMCIDYNDKMWVFGGNSDAELGIGHRKDIFEPILHPTLKDLNIIDISSGGWHTFVKTIDNKIYAFGQNKYSQLGIKTSEDHQLTPIQVLEGQEDIWCSKIGKSRAKSARK